MASPYCREAESTREETSVESLGPVGVASLDRVQSLVNTLEEWAVK